MIVIRFQAFLLICKRNSESNFKGLHFLTCCARGGGGGGYSGLSDGWSKDFLGLKCLIPGFFSWGRKIWQVFFGWYFYLSRDFFVLYQLMLSGNFWGSEILRRIFRGLIFARSVELAIIILHPTGASGITVLLKTLTKYWKFFPTLFVKQSIFSLFLNFEQKRTVTIFGEHGIINN